MNDIIKVLLFASAGGIPIFIGGFISSRLQEKQFKLKSELNCWVIAFGGGALLSATAFALVPQGAESLSVLELILMFFLGTVTFIGIDIVLSRRKSSMAQVLSMMSDSVPEALALGASFVHNQGLGLLLAIFIGLQNFPEGFNSYVELKKMMSKTKVLWFLFWLSLIPIISALCGKLFLENSPKIVGSMMIFAAGGIIYLIFQDIAPLAKEKKSFGPATGASLGFLIGMMGEVLIK